MAISKRVREIVYQKYNGHCAYCGKEITMKEMQCDHIQSRYHNGTDDISNLMPSCRACNFRKGTWTIDQFRNELREQARTLTKTFQGRMSLQYGLIEYHDHPIVFYFEKKRK